MCNSRIDVIVRQQPGVPPRASVFTAPDQTVLDFRHPPADRGHIARYVFGGFARCLFDKQKFHSDTERALAVILDRDSERWFRPASGQFQIFYRDGHAHREYVPDFVAESADAIFMLEPKAANEMQTAEVLAKRDAAVEWCRQASDHAAAREGKPWRYLLIPHRAIAENMSLTGLAAEYGVTRA
jgi:type III restriction enzyme